ncbi:unnamed protein product [Caenorhabditis nigoni]
MLLPQISLCVISILISIVAGYVLYDNEHHRIRRGAPNGSFDTMVDKMEKVSRIINGIAIQQSLIDGSISPDALISELLNFGNTTATQLLTIDTGKLTQLAKDVQGLPNSLQVDNSITEMENRLKLISKMVEKSNGVAELKAPTIDYLNDARAFKNAAIDWDNLKSLVTHFKFLSQYIATLKASNLERYVIGSQFHSMQFTVNSIKSVQIDAYPQKLKSDVLPKLDETFAPFTSFLSSVLVFRTNTKLYDNTMDPPTSEALGKQMTAVGTVGSTANSRKSEIENLNKIFISRDHPSGNRVLLHSSGLSNGFSDVEHIFEDLKDPWVQEAVDGQSEVLSKALDSVRNIGQKCRLVDGSIRSNDIKNVMAFSTIDRVLEVTFSLKKTNSLDKMLSLTTPPSNQNDYPDKLKELKASKEYQDLVVLMESLEPTLQILGDDPSITESAEIVVDNNHEVTDFIKDSTRFLDFLKKLRSIDELKLVPEAIDSIRKLRSINIQNFDPVATSLVKFKSTLEDLQKSVNELKGVNSDNNPLATLPNVQKDSSNIGSSTRVMRSIRLASGTNLKLDQAKMDVLRSEMGNLTDSKDVANLNKLFSLGPILDKFNKEVKAVKSSAVDSSSSDLASLDMTLGLKVKGISTDFSAIGKSLDKLLETSQRKDELLEVKKTVDSLDSLGLDYAKHHTAIKASKSSLESMDSFFAELKTAQDMLKDTSIFSNVWFIISLVLILLLIAGIVFHFVMLYRNKKKNEQKSRTEPPASGVLNLNRAEFSDKKVKSLLAYQISSSPQIPGRMILKISLCVVSILTSIVAGYVPYDNEQHHRIRRGAPNGAFETMVDKMEKASRVINGISIQQSLIEGNISPDALISELLNFGNVTATQLLTIDTGNLTKLIKDIQELPKRIFESRDHRSGNRVLLHSSGLSNGFSDVEHIFEDLKDSWIQDAVDGQSEVLSKALDSVRNIGKKCRLVDGSVRSKDAKDLMNQLNLEVSELAELSQLDSIAPKLLNIVKAVDDLYVLPNSKDIFRNFHESVVQLSSKLKAIDRLLEVTFSLRNTKKQELDHLIALTEKQSDRKKYPGKLKELKKSKEYQDLVVLVESLEPTLRIIGDHPSIAEPAGIVVDNHGDVGTFIKDSTKFLTVLKKLHVIDELKFVPGAVDAVRKYRSINIQNFDPVSTSLVKFKSTLEDLQKSVKQLKGVNPDNNPLATLPNVQKDSSNIGSSTRVMRSIRLASEGKPTLDKAKMDVLKSEMARLTDPEDVNNLNKSLSLGPILDKFNKDVKAVKSSAVDSSSPDLASLDMSLGLKVKGISIDFSAISKSLDKLLETSQRKDELLEVKKTVDSLDSLGLDYAKHHSAIKASKSALESMDSFFAQLKTAQDLLNETPFYQQTWFMIGVPLVLLVLIAILVFLFVMRGRKTKDPRDPYHLLRAFFNRFLGMIYLKMREIQIMKLGMQYTQSAVLTRYYMGLYDQDSKENFEDITKSVKAATTGGRHKHLVALGDQNRVLLNDGERLCGQQYYHGNVVPLKHEREAVVCQTPHHDDKIDTRGAYWLAMAEMKSRLAICFGKVSCRTTAEEPPVQPYFPLNGGSASYCDGKVNIKCLAQEKKNKSVDMLTLEVKVQNKKAFKCQMALVEGWPEDRFPDPSMCQDIVTLFDDVYASPGPVFIACPTGTGKSAVFTLALMAREEMLEKRGKISMGSLLNDLRQYRAMAIENAKQYLLAFILIVKDAAWKVNKELLDEESKRMMNELDGFLNDIIEHSDGLDETYQKMLSEEAAMQKAQAGKPKPDPKADADDGTKTAIPEKPTNNILTPGRARWTMEKKTYRLKDVLMKMDRLRERVEEQEARLYKNENEQNACAMQDIEDLENDKAKLAHYDAELAKYYKNKREKKHRKNKRRHRSKSKIPSSDTPLPAELEANPPKKLRGVTTKYPEMGFEITTFPDIPVELELDMDKTAIDGGAN